MTTLHSSSFEKDRGRESSDAVAEEIRKEFEAANEDRDYSIYTRSLDAALEAKTQSVLPHFNAEEGDVVVDAGSGTGAFAEYAARHLRGVRVYALDLSHELLERAVERETLARMIYGNVAEQNFPDNSIKVKTFLSVCHELFSFGGESALRQALQAALRELVPGGRTIIRDFAKPEQQEPVYMKILSRAGLDRSPEGTPGNPIDYNILSARALLERFRQEFNGGGAFAYELMNIGGEEYIKMLPEWAHEFYLRKDYTANWRQEIREKYTFWTPEQARRSMTEMGYTNIQVIPAPNNYVLQKRLQGKVELFEMKNGALVLMPFPATHMIIVAEKPQATTRPSGTKLAQENWTARPSAVERALPKAINYAEILKTIVHDPAARSVRIGNKEFHLENEEPTRGSKKLIFTLKGEPARLLKTVRPDTLNPHNAFTSLFQTIERERILDDYHIPHTRIQGYDKEGPPYRYLIQDATPKTAQSAADLIRTGTLTEDDIREITEFIGIFEQEKKWQLDTNPFNWFRVEEAGKTPHLVYVDGKVYRYDERWEFRRIGLLQWLNPNYVARAVDNSAAIPTAQESQRLSAAWKSSAPGEFHPEMLVWWKRHLNPSITP
ncbi:MAG: hypothetical protein A3J67_04650 [Parcubacteria group bacterium RIFCSPHIGHO2_02_FULL_48_10b]|nr:MAG: hypothetical protein A3J67_04650 [Parcubacteria group bacterium RIFCSPHIGHO2_02_FULL_48_10b]